MINWTARAKSEILETAGRGTDKTRETPLLSVSSVAHGAIYEKTEGVSSVSSVGVQPLSEKHVFLEPPAGQNPGALAQAYHAHHFNCPQCIAAGRGAVYGDRCDVGSLLWSCYQNTEGKK